MIRSLLLLVRPFRSIAASLTRLVTLYELDLKSRGVYIRPVKYVKDDADIMYGSEDDGKRVDEEE